MASAGKQRPEHNHPARSRDPLRCQPRSPLPRRLLPPPREGQARPGPRAPRRGRARRSSAERRGTRTAGTRPPAPWPPAHACRTLARRPDRVPSRRASLETSKRERDRAETIAGDGAEQRQRGQRARLDRGLALAASNVRSDRDANLSERDVTGYPGGCGRCSATSKSRMPSAKLTSRCLRAWRRDTGGGEA